MTIHWVHGPADAQLRVEAINAPDDGTLAVRLDAGPYRRSGIARQILAGLGKTPEIAGPASRGGSEWRFLRAWVESHRLDRVVIGGIEQLRPKELRNLIDHLAQTPADVWLWTVPALSNAHIRDFDQLTTRVEWDDFVARFPPLPPPSTDPEPEAAAAYPQVPVEEFTTFRAACRDLLSPPDFERVDADYRAAYAAASAIITAEVVVERTADLLADRWGTCASDAEPQVVLRATQAALFCAGWYLGVALPEFLTAIELRPRTATRPLADWRRLRAYIDPVIGAATALSAAGMELPELVSLMLVDVESDGAAAVVAGRRYVVDEPGRAFVQAQLLYRLERGSRPTDPLLVRGERNPTSATVSHALRVPVRDLGLGLIPPRALRQAGTGPRWLATHGLSLTRLV